MAQSDSTKYSRVVFLGGAPMVGKTTVARLIAHRLDYDCISTDDVGAAISSLTEQGTHPAFHYMDGQDYREYYVTRNPRGLIQDITGYHEALWPGLETLFRNHATWSTAAVIEGWALRPSYVARLSGDISGVFLLSDDALIEARTRLSSFSDGASDQATMIQRYIERSRWYNSLIQDEAARLRLNTVAISLETRAEEIVEKCLGLLV
jgi:2-phosphoglycerate kinase